MKTIKVIILLLTTASIWVMSPPESEVLAIWFCSPWLMPLSQIAPKCPCPFASMSTHACVSACHAQEDLKMASVADNLFWVIGKHQQRCGERPSKLAGKCSDFRVRGSLRYFVPYTYWADWKYNEHSDAHLWKGWSRHLIANLCPLRSDRTKPLTDPITPQRRRRKPPNN